MKHWRDRKNDPGAAMYAGGDDFASYDKLAKNLSRERPKQSTLDFAKLTALQAEQRTQPDSEACRQEALRQVVAASQRQAEKAGKTVSAENLQQMENAAAERLECDPKMVDRVLQMEDVRQQQAGERTAQHEAPDEAPVGGRWRKFNFEQLRQQNAESMASLDQEDAQETGG